jgi:RNA polymerase sigma-70 factor (sigma-E family)
MDDREDAFCAFVAARSRALNRTAYLLTGNRSAAEDLVQTSLLKVYLAWPRIRDLGVVEDYTRTVMVRTQVSFWRKGFRRELSMAEVPDTAGAATGWAAGRGGSRIEDRDELWRALTTLGARQRAVIVLRFYEDLTEAEIARVLDCSVGTVKSQLSRGLARMHQRLAGAGGGVGGDDPDGRAAGSGAVTTNAGEGL